MTQKTCHYCNTPADNLATKCESCGSALPVAIPRPVAQMIVAQGRWRYSKTVAVTLFISLAAGWIFKLAGGLDRFGLVAFLVLLWILTLMPAMLLYSGWTNSRRNIGKIAVYFLGAAIVWFVNIMIIFAFSNAVPAG